MDSSDQVVHRAIGVFERIATTLEEQTALHREQVEANKIARERGEQRVEEMRVRDREYGENLARSVAQNDELLGTVSRLTETFEARVKTIIERERREAESRG
jgi:hypothetical protein